MVTESQERKSLRLNNWHLYLLGKLNERYNKAELCDITLRFKQDNTAIQAHRVVLSTCTTYFDSLPSTPAGITVNLPECFSSNQVKAIINFMYTGKLEYRPEEKEIIVDAAKRFGMTVLTELLQVPESKRPVPSIPPVPPSIPRKHQTVAKQDALIKQYITKHSRTSATNLKPSVTPTVVPSNMPDMTALGLPPDVIVTDTPTTLPGKKLPFWKKRSTTQLPEEFYRSSAINKPPLVVEAAKPTRFEWTEEETLPETEHSFNVIDTFEYISYDSKMTILKQPIEPRPFVSDIAVVPAPTKKGIQGIKRARVSEVVRGRIEDDDDYDDGHFETIHDLDDDYDDDPTPSEHFPTTTPPKPILKTQATPSPSKRVRFSFSGEKPDENINRDKCSPVVTPVPKPPLHQSSSQKTPSAPKIVDPPSTQVSNLPVDSAKPLDIAKIANEVIKKYPNLVRSKKNITLKIQSPSGTQNSILDKDGKVTKSPRLQVVVMKSELNSIIKQETKGGLNLGAENRSGPWFCVSCADELGPMNFKSYYDYRKHLEKVHNERIDARICEHCGFKASKRNLHLYHMYTKHDIAPPRNIHFPKCDQCTYIALSESLLIKHRMNHTGLINKEYVCRICNAAFKSNGALMGHMQTNLHQVDQGAKRDYECEFCGKIFNRNINLKAHVRTTHQEETIRKMYEEEDKIDEPPEVEVIEQRNENVMEVIEVPVFDSVQNTNKTLYLPQGMTILAEAPNLPLMPSSESEAMNNVATGIATSINITDRNISNDVIVIDNHPELILQGSQSTYVLNPDGSYSLQEYIVPEIMNDTGQVFTTALVSTAPSTGIGFVNSDNISIITSSSDHTYADEVKLNGHVATTSVSLTTPGTTVITSSAQEVRPIIMQEPIIVSGDWVQSIATSQTPSMNLGQRQKVEIISAPLFQGEQKVEIISASSSHQPQLIEVQRTAQKLVNDWGDLEEDQEDRKDNDNETEVKPSRPTIDLENATDLEHI